MDRNTTMHVRLHVLLILLAIMLLGACTSTGSSEVADDIAKAAVEPGKSSYCLTFLTFELCYTKDRTVYTDSQ